MTQPNQQPRTTDGDKRLIRMHREGYGRTVIADAPGRSKAAVTKRKQATMPDELSLAVVGARFDSQKRKGMPRGNRQAEILICEPGEPVVLIHEPKNANDANATGVYSRCGVRLGYISANRTSIIHRAWEAARDVRAVFQEPITGGGAIRVAFDRDPVLPTKKLAGYVPAARGASAGEWDGIDYLPPDD